MKESFPEPQKPAHDNGINRVLEELKARRNAFLESIKSLPHERFSLPAEEFEHLVRVARMLDDFKSAIAEGRGSDFNRQRIEELMLTLDSLELWASKFSTECAGGTAIGSELEPSSPDDSIYYVTPSGATLRLKMVELAHGMDAVIQGFMEKIVFDGPENKVSEVPEIGYKVEEYVSRGFGSAIKAGDMSAYKPELEIYRDQGEIATVTKTDPRTGHITSGSDHTGDRVNRIFFRR